MTDSSDLTFRQMFTKHMVDQSITQLWKNTYSMLAPFLCKFSAKNRFVFEVMCAIPCLEFVFFLIAHFCKPFCSNRVLPHLFSKVLSDPVTSSNLESASEIHVCSQYWVFCSAELWLPFYCLLWFLHLSLPAWGISHFLTFFFSACVLWFSENLTHACKGLVCWLQRVSFPAFGRVASTVPLQKTPLPEQQLRNKSSRTPLLPYSCSLIVLKIGICIITSNIWSNRAVRFNLC